MKRERLLALLMAFMMICFCIPLGYGIEVQAADYPTSGTVNATSLNVRSGAGTNYSILGTVKKGQAVTITGRANDFYSVTIKGKFSNKVVYLYADYVTVGAPQTNEQPTTSEYPKTGTVTTDNVNVRTGASTSSKIKGVVNKGQKVTVTGKSGNFYQVTISDKYGNTKLYISADYVNIGGKVDDTPQNTSEYPKTGTVTTDNVNVRTGASTSSKIKGVVNKGQKVTITGKNGKFYQVTISDKYGNTKLYISADYVNVGGNVSDNNPQPSSTYPIAGTVTIDNVNVRTEASTSSRIKGVVNKGQKVTITDKKNNFYQVTISDKYGSAKLYICADYVIAGGSVAPSNGDNSTQQPTVTSGKAYVSSAIGCNLRTGPSTSNERIAILDYQQEIEIVSTSGLWYQVNAIVGGVKKTGYVYKANITVK